MIKYKVNFEVTNVLSDFMPFNKPLNKEKWIELQKELIKSSVNDMELEYQDITLMEVTNFKIEEVEDND